MRSKLSSVNNSAPYNNADLPAGVKNPQVALASDPIPAGDIAFVSTVFTALSSSVCCLSQAMQSLGQAGFF